MMGRRKESGGRQLARHSCLPPPPFVRSSLQCGLHPSLDQVLEHRCKLGSGSDSPRATRAPTSSFFTGVDGECEGISCRDRFMEAGEEHGHALSFTLPTQAQHSGLPINFQFFEMHLKSVSREETSWVQRQGRSEPCARLQGQQLETSVFSATFRFESMCVCL